MSNEIVSIFLASVAAAKRLGMERYERLVRAFACCLSALAGYVDAVGFVESRGFFVSFMSGNSTRLGVGISEAILDAAAAGGLIVAFVGGVTVGSLVGHAAKEHRAVGVLMTIGFLLAVAAAAGGAGLLHLALGLAAFAMGAENAIFEQNGQARIGLTYMTGSLVRVGQGLAGTLQGRIRGQWTAYAALWAGFVAGAVLGAAASTSLGLGSLWLASVLAILLAFVSSRVLGPWHGSA